MNRTERPSRTSINGTRHILNVKGKEPGYEYRFVLDQEGRIAQMEERGYEVVRDKNVKVGDKRVANPTSDGTPVTASAGGGNTLVLMRIKSEWFLEDQNAKQKMVDDSESSMKAAAAEQGLYGKLEITRS